MRSVLKLSSRIKGQDCIVIVLWYCIFVEYFKNFNFFCLISDFCYIERRSAELTMYRQLSNDKYDVKNMMSESNGINNGHHLNRTASMPNSTASSLNQLRNSTVNNEDERQRLHCKNAIHLAVPMAKKVRSYHIVVTK